MDEPMSEAGEAPRRAKSKKAVAAPVPERPRGGAARSVADMLPDVGRAAFRRFGFIQSAVVSRWAEIVGQRYAAVSTPESIRFPHGQRADGVLTLEVQGAHGTMMQHVLPEIIERVNRFFGYAAVARVVIRPATAMPLRKAPPSLRMPSVTPAAIDLGDSLRTVGDPELRACLASLAGALSATTGAPIIGEGEGEK
jgi:hypothetical protein